jgi:DNA polymerase eta
MRKNGEPSTPSPAPIKAQDTKIHDEPIEVLDNDDDATIPAWTCPKCGFRPDGQLGDEEQKGQKQEHEDFHFAQELQDAGSSPVRSMSVQPKPKGPGTGARKKTKKDEGIKAFFAPKSTGKG